MTTQRPIPRHPRVFLSRLKTRIPFLVWLAVAALAIFVYLHGGQFGGMTGTVLTSFDQATPLETGRLKSLFVQMGDSVDAGTPLAQMDATLLEAEKEIFEAEAQAQHGALQAVTDEVIRLEKLREQHLASEQDLLSLRVKQKTLQAVIDASEIKKQIRLLDLRIENYTLRAQASGTVSRILHAPGDIVSSGDPVLASVIHRPPTVVGFLSELNAHDVQVGMEAYLTPISGRGAVIPAKVISLTPEVFALPGRVNPLPSQAYRGRRVILEPQGEVSLLPGEEVQIQFRRPWTLQPFNPFNKKQP
ncbi:MAG: HlyD family efflux transporter periplasmic adaptor subunit [Victivallales bacterium]|nr:HlyD family efflux transporter periplasmic adaptor subunit [Victivallales bacterium]